MARTALPLTNLVKDSGFLEVAGTTVDPTNGHYIDCGSQSGRVLIVVNNTFAGTKVVTIKAGANPPSQRASLGDITFTAQASARSYVGPVESGRVVQAPGGTDGGTGGRIFVDLAASITGTIWAYLIPDAL